ncbi:MAG: (5-formylfuran-3-yl)methyl phosphate synthase, partial [Asgard group archaeon]|nr:(5-formylfuran-3-yl)methyl phosphate synthase [Asgard group archaeon]
KELQRFINKSYNRGLKTALGGGIQIKHLTKIAKLNPDVIGIRGAVCQKGDRVQGEINRKLIQKFQKNFRKIINE